MVPSGGRLRGLETFSITLWWWRHRSNKPKELGPYVCGRERVVSEGVKGEESSGSNCHTYSYPFNSKPRKLETHASPCLSVGSSCLSTQILCHLSNKNICVFVTTFLVSKQLMKSPSTIRINLDKF